MARYNGNESVFTVEQHAREHYAAVQADYYRDNRALRSFWAGLVTCVLVVASVLCGVAQMTDPATLASWSQTLTVVLK